MLSPESRLHDAHLTLFRRPERAPASPRYERAPAPYAERTRALELVRRFGWNATSFQTLEPAFEYVFDGDDACVAYVDTGGAWIAAGAPIAPAQRLAAVAERFVQQARERGKRAAFFATERRFAELTAFGTKLIGEQPIWNPSAWEPSLRSSRSLREQLRRARAKGVRVRDADMREVAHARLPLRAALDGLVSRWSAARPMPPMGFLVSMHPFELLSERRIVVAETDAGPCAFAVVAPVYARNGWFVQHLVRAPDAPNGTIELLVDHILRDAAVDERSYVTLGLAPLAGAVDVELRAARTLGRSMYNFGGLHAFKAKLLPTEWSPIYLSYPPSQSSYVAIYDSLVAFSRGSLLRFCAAGLLSGPPRSY